MEKALEGKKRKVSALTSSLLAEPTGQGDPSARFIQALRQRNEKILESLPWIPTLEQVMEVYEGLPKLTMTEEESLDYMMHLN